MANIKTPELSLATFELLLTCFRSGQMTYPQLTQHMREVPAFAEYVRERVK